MEWHTIDCAAAVASLIYGDYSYMLFKPLEVKVVLISKGGAKLTAARNSLAVGSQFELSIALGGRDSSLHAEVVHALDTEDGTEYMCRFISKDAPAEKISLCKI